MASVYGLAQPPTHTGIPLFPGLHHYTSELKHSRPYEMNRFIYLYSLAVK